jgi:hypothetical protein
MMPENSWYGHGFVLARYCAMEALRPPIFGSLHHGWAPEYSFEVGRLRQLPRLVWNEQQAGAARAAGHPKVVVVGAPFVYAAASLGATAPTPAARGEGTLLMPRHSTPGIELAAEHAELIEEVEASEEPPYTVALFYLDLAQAEVRIPYERAGWRITSFGTREEDLFLYRVISEMSRHRTVVANGISTALWYGAQLGRRIRVLATDPDPRVPGRGDDAASNARRWPGVYGVGVEGPAAEALAAVELGATAQLAPDDLITALGWDRSHRALAAVGRALVDARHGRALRRGEEHGAR